MQWRSEDFSKVAQYLDQQHFDIRDNSTYSGSVLKDLALYKRISLVSTLSPNLNPSHVPRGLPNDCYSPLYLASLNPQQLRLLNPQNPINLPALLEILSSSNVSD